MELRRSKHRSKYTEFENQFRDLIVGLEGKLRLPKITARPFPKATSGTPISFKFSPKTSSFRFVFESQLAVCKECCASHPWPSPQADVQLKDSSSLPDRIVTEIFFPNQHYSDPNLFIIKSSDIWVIDSEKQSLKILIGMNNAYFFGLAHKFQDILGSYHRLSKVL